MAKKILIDCFGHPSTSHRYQDRRYDKHAVRIVTGAEGVTYLCFGRRELQPVQRIRKDADTGETILEWAFGRWAERESLVYDHTLNDPIAVDPAWLEGGEA